MSLTSPQSIYQVLLARTEFVIVVCPCQALYGGTIILRKHQKFTTTLMSTKYESRQKHFSRLSSLPLNVAKTPQLMYKKIFIFLHQMILNLFMRVLLIQIARIGCIHYLPKKNTRVTYGYCACQLTTLVSVSVSLGAILTPKRN